jgi:hypothetical protein
MRTRRELAIVSILVGVAACRVPRYYRYYASPKTAPDERKEIAERAQFHGMSRTGLEGYAVEVDVKELEAEEDLFEVEIGASSKSKESGRRAVRISTDAFATPTGSTIELTAPTRDLLDRLAPGGRTYHAVDAAYFAAGVQPELVAEAGVLRAPGTDGTWRTDASAGLTLPIITGGGGGIEPADRYRFGVRALAGIAVDGREAVAFHPELGLSLDWQKTASPVPGRIIPQGRRYTVDLSVAALLDMGNTAGRRGVEAGLAVHVQPYGGLFVRVGHEWSDLEPAGRTITVGARLDTKPALLIASAALLGALIYGIATADFPDCAGRDCGDEGY